MSTKNVAGWDKVIRLSHWTISFFFIANVFFIDPDAFLSDYITLIILPDFFANASPHEWAGWTILAALIIRIIWGTTLAQGPNLLSSFVPNVQNAKEHLGHLKRRQPQTDIGHNSLGAIAVYIMWVGLIVIIFSGWAQDTDWGFDNNVDRWHQWSVDAMTIFVYIHVGAVITTSILLKQPLIRAMIKTKKITS